jgi:hypothetical protein
MMSLSKLSIKDVGAGLARAVNMRARPICVYGSDSIPDDGVEAASIGTCVAGAMYSLAVSRDTFPLYAGLDGGRFCRCMGGPAWFGYGPFDPGLMGLISTGSKDMKGVAPKLLKKNEKVTCDTYNALGKIRPLGRYTIMRACDGVEEDPGVQCIVCFATGEQVRDLCALAHFRSGDAFAAVSLPWGPSCATLVTYPAGMAENMPKGRVSVGPTDPSAREWLPEGYMAIGIPVKTARQMARDVETSFISKRART